MPKPLRHVARRSLGLHVLLPVVAAGCAASAPPGHERVGTSNDPVTEKCGASAEGAVQGRDTSIYQGDFDWAATRVDFGYARVSDGLGDVDSEFDHSWAHMKDAKIRRGAYQFFEPSESATEQAKLVISKVGKLGAGDLPAMIDVEMTDGRSPAEMASAIRTWLETVEAGTGLRPIIYVGSYFWQDNVGDTSFGQYPIWIAAYGTACPSLPPGWSNWTFWQYSDGGGALDHDVFNGSLADLEKLEGGSAPAKPPAPLYSSAVIQNSAGELQVFSRGGGNALYERSQEASGGWSGWEDLDGELYRDVAVARNADGRLEVFGIGGGEHMFHKWQETPGSAWSGWASLGGAFTSAPSVVLDSAGRLVVFGRGTNDAIYRASQVTAGGAWTGWESLGGTLTSDPSAAVNADGRLEVFARGGSDVPFHIWEESVGGAWSPWESLGGALDSDPVAARDGDGRLVVLGVGTNHEAYRNSQKAAGGAWTGWERLGGVFTSSLAVVVNDTHRLEVFGRGTDGAMYHAWEESSGSFSGWASLGGRLTSNPSIGVDASGRMELFGRGTNDELYYVSQDKAGGAWSAWQSLGGTIQ